MHAWITGMEKQRDLMSSLSKPEKFDMAMSEIVSETVKLMKLWCPRFTGYTEDTIMSIKKGLGEYNIWTASNYAQFTEYGTKYINIGTVDNPMYVKSMSGKMSYRPWMRPAVWHMMNKYPEILKRALFRKLG